MKIKLGEVCEINPKNPSFADNFEVSFIPMPKVSEDGVIDPTEIKPYAEVKKGFTYFEEQDVLFAKITPCMENGKGAIAIGLKNRTGFGSTEFHVLRPNNNVITSKWLFYLTSWNIFRKECEKNMTGSAGQKRVPKSFLEHYSINLPDVNEQDIQSAILNKISDLIAMRRKQLQKLDDLVKSRFVEMFGDPFNNKKWDTQKLRNISISISDGSNVNKEYYKEKDDVLFLRIQNVWFNEFRLDDSVYISEDVNNEYLDTSLHHGDLLITKIGRYYTKDSSLGRVSVYLGEDDKANYSNNIMRVRLTDEVCSEFVNVLLNLDDYNRYIREVSVGGTDKRALSKAIIGDLPIIMPPKELQIEFLEFVKQTDKSKLTIQQSLDKLELMKKALMQKYFG